MPPSSYMSLLAKISGDIICPVQMKLLSSSQEMEHHPSGEISYYDLVQNNIIFFAWTMAILLIIPYTMFSSSPMAIMAGIENYFTLRHPARHLHLCGNLLAFPKHNICLFGCIHMKANTALFIGVIDFFSSS